MTQQKQHIKNQALHSIFRHALALYVQVHLELHLENSSDAHKFPRKSWLIILYLYLEFRSNVYVATPVHPLLDMMPHHIPMDSPLYSKLKTCMVFQAQYKQSEMPVQLHDRDITLTYLSKRNTYMALAPSALGP